MLSAYHLNDAILGGKFFADFCRFYLKIIYILKEYKILYKLMVWRQNSKQIYGAQLLFFSIFLKNMLLKPDRMSHHYYFTK
ncbi:hypothetical protein BpHYR1_047110 [Brachionus plicatilis]|uniref:Uncharacterized protein n=1 Tax=Brachionus plicatilis TaxID=10195 RepID=A0A3M7Q0Q7_BRAPC|nr:hypothetical protein BpHYR1_047110 [Brachionus plicatilis]